MIISEIDLLADFKKRSTRYARKEGFPFIFEIILYSQKLNVNPYNVQAIG